MVGKINIFSQEQKIQLNHLKNLCRDKDYNISNPAFPVVMKRVSQTTETDSLKSQLKSWFAFDIGLKTIGLAYNKIKNGIKHLRGINPENTVKICDRFFTANKIGFKLGNDAIEHIIKNKTLPNLFKTPLQTLESTIGNVTAEKGIQIASKSSLFSRILKPLFKFSGVPFMIVIDVATDMGQIIKAFKQGPAEGFKQIGKSAVRAGINASAFCGGELLGATAGAFIGGAIGSIIPIAGTALGAQIGGWIGGMAGGCTASYYSRNFTKSVLSPNFKTHENKPVYA